MASKSLTCAGCLQEITDGQYLSCMTCKLPFDPPCTNLGDNFLIMKQDSKNKWMCHSCRYKQPKCDNTNTPVRPIATVFTIPPSDSTPGCSVDLPINHPNVTKRGEIPKSFSDESDADDLESTASNQEIPEPGGYYTGRFDRGLALDIKMILEQMAVLNRRLYEVSASVGMCNDKLDECGTKLVEVDERIQSLEFECRKQNVCNCSCHSKENKQVGKNANSRRKGKTTNLPPPAPTPEPPVNYENENLQQGSAKNTPNPVIHNPTSHPASLKNPSLSKETDGARSGDSEEEAKSGDDLWIQVPVRKPRHTTSRRCTAGPDVTSLKAVEPRKFVHLWNMASEAQEVLSYLQQLCPTGLCTVEELKPRGSYKSFKIGVPEAFHETCLSTDIWPNNSRVKAWVSFRGQRSNSKPVRKTHLN